VTQPASGWSEASKWDDETCHRESFRLSSGDDKLYASLYSSRPTTPKMGVVVLPHWGHDGRFLLEWCHALALGAARLGGCGLLVHWPGSEDSEGDPGRVTVDQLVQAVLSALCAGKERLPEVPWSVAGVRLGATVASIAAARAEAHKVALVQPVLDPEPYFNGVERRARLVRALTRGAPHPGWGFGEEVPSGLRGLSAGLVRKGLEGLRADVAVVHYRLPVLGPLPPNIRDITVRGKWSRPYEGDNAALRREALNFLSGRPAWRSAR
jgi:hypothetical protein